MLRGNALAKVDDKGRLKLPSSFRAVIEPEFGNEFFVTSLRGESVDSTWAADYFAANTDEGNARLEANLEPRIAPRPDSDWEQTREESANVEKLFWGPTAVKLDGQGRIYIVDSLRQRLQIYRWED